MSLRTGPRIPESEDVVKSDVLTPQHKGDCMLKRIGRRIFLDCSSKAKVSFLRLGIDVAFQIGQRCQSEKVTLGTGLTRKRRPTRLPCGTYAFWVEGGMAGQSEVPTRPMFGLIDRSSLWQK